MDIFLTKEGSSIGPFSADELRRKIASGEVGAEESAWSAEVGEWRRLEQVLAHAAGDFSPGGGDGAEPAESGRKKSNKLRAPDGMEMHGAGFAGSVSAVPDVSERKREVRRLGGSTARRANPLSFLRWLGVIAVAGYLFAALLPWVKTSYAGASSEQTVLALVTMKAEAITLPGKTTPPKYFGVSKILLVLASALVGLATLLSFSNARNDDAATSGMGMIMGFLAGLSLVGFGVIYSELFEREFAEILANSGAGEVEGIEFAMGSGFYFALAAVALLVVSVIVPQVLRRSFVRSMGTTVVTLLLSAGLVYVGVQRLSADALEAATGDIKQMFEQGVDAVKGTIDKVGDRIGGDKPESDPAPPAEGAQ